MPITIEKIKLVALDEDQKTGDVPNFVYVLTSDGWRWRGIVPLDIATMLTAAAESQGLKWQVLDSMSGVGILDKHPEGFTL